MSDTLLIIQRFDALDAGDVGLFMTTGGGVGAHIRDAEIRSGSVLRSLVGFGGGVDRALGDLWRRIEDMTPDEVVVVGAFTGNRRHYRWNGAAWKQIPREVFQ